MGSPKGDLGSPDGDSGFRLGILDGVSTNLGEEQGILATPLGKLPGRAGNLGWPECNLDDVG